MFPTLTLADRLGFLSHVSKDVAYVFEEYERPFSQGRVVDSAGQVVQAISAELAASQARVMDAVAQFERTAALDLAALERRTA